MASRLLLAAALVVGITCGVRVDIMRARREYPSNEYKGLDKTDVLANASSKANNVSTDLRSLAGIGPVPNATEHMKKWPTCQKLAVVKGGEEASAKIAKDSCREVPRNDVAALDNCFRGACFVALNGDKPARDGQTANSTEEVPENTPASRMGGEGQKNTTTGERITTFNGVKLQPGERVKDGEVVPMGKLSTKEYAILASLMPGHRVSHFCQLDGHVRSRSLVLVLVLILVLVLSSVIWLLWFC